MLIPTSEYEERIESCQEFLQRTGLQALLAYSDRRYAMGQGVEVGHNVRYYAGFRFPPEDIHEEAVVLPYQKGEAIVVIPRDGEPALLICRTGEDLAKRQTWIRDVRSSAPDYLGDERITGLARMTRSVLEEHGVRGGKIGIAGAGVTWQLYDALVRLLPKASFIGCTEDVDRMRMVKSDNELKIMRKAAEIADAGVDALLETAREGATEYEVHQAAEKAMLDAGGDNPWTVIMSGPRAFISYLSPDYTQRQLKSGDMLHADIGSEFAGYHSDIQPVAIVGRPRREQISLLETNMKIIRAMIEATRPGVSDKKIVESALRAAHGEQFGERLRTDLFGHGYGVGVDPPNFTSGTLRKRSDEEIILKPNMVLCYEPGLFVPGVGGVAIEDEVVVTNDCCEVISGCLSKAEKLYSKLQSLK